MKYHQWPQAHKSQICKIISPNKIFSRVYFQVTSVKWYNFNSGVINKIQKTVVNCHVSIKLDKQYFEEFHKPETTLSLYNGPTAFEQGFYF